MKTKKFLRPLIMAVCMLVLGAGYAQVTQVGNNGFNSATDFVGWDNTVVNDPLQIRHNANQPIQWFTDARPADAVVPNASVADHQWL